jgi:uncharacterized protein
MKQLLIWGIQLYRWFISPLLGSSCRFQPTCSQYGMEAIARFGAIKGSKMTIARICRCHPWREGGYDPVPEEDLLENDRENPNKNK